MDNLKLIEDLKQDIPQTVAVIGYGSGIYKQTGYKQGEIPDKDVIIVVDDFKQFLLDDYDMNNHHFASEITKKNIERKKCDSFYSNIGCLKFNHNNVHFKALIVSRKALEQDLKTWKFFGMAGRLTKPILYQNLPTNLKESIKNNRRSILITALLFNTDDILKPIDLYNTISNLTYLYDFRTILPGEKKSKASDIVNGAFDFFDMIYGHTDIALNEANLIYNSHPVELIEQLPLDIKLYIFKHFGNFYSSDINKEKLIKISKIIKYYFRKTNFINSAKLAMSSSSTLGFSETVKHGLGKVKRHFVN